MRLLSKTVLNDGQFAVCNLISYFTVLLHINDLVLRNEWSQPVYPGYDSKLTDPNGIIYPPRPPGARLPE